MLNVHEELLIDTENLMAINLMFVNLCNDRDMTKKTLPCLKVFTESLLLLTTKVTFFHQSHCMIWFAFFLFNAISTFIG